MRQDEIEDYDDESLIDFIISELENKPIDRSILIKLVELLAKEAPDAQ